MRRNRGDQAAAVDADLAPRFCHVARGWTRTSRVAQWDRGITWPAMRYTVVIPAKRELNWQESVRQLVLYLDLGLDGLAAIPHRICYHAK